MTSENFEEKVRQARAALITCMVDAGAEIFSESEPFDDLDDGEDEPFDQDLTCLLLNDVEYYVGPATCDPSTFDELVTDKDFKLVTVQRNGHHHFEIAAIAVMGSPLSPETLNELTFDLRPDTAESYVRDGDTFSDGSLRASFCEPFAIEVSVENQDNNVWVVRRFRVEDTDSDTFTASVSEVIDLVNRVRLQVLS